MLHISATPGKSNRHEQERISETGQLFPPLLTGNDLIKLGMKPGPALGALLNEIREKQLADELKTPRQAKAWTKKQIKK